MNTIYEDYSKCEALSLLFLSLASNASSQENPSLGDIDRVRLAEAFNVGEKLGDGPLGPVARALSSVAGCATELLQAGRNSYFAQKFDKDEYFIRAKFFDGTNGP